MITLQRLSNSWLLFFPLCPSTNARVRPVRMGSLAREILTNEARDYIKGVGFELAMLVKREKIPPVKTFTYFDLWFILPRTNCDAHNYGKVLFDAMETGGLVMNDKYILPRIMGFSFGKPTEAVVKIPFPNLP